MRVNTLYIIRLLGVLFLATFPVAAFGEAGAEDFQPARPGRVFQFPRDHGAHPEFKTEWWYYTGHLKAQGGESFGYQLTFFRVGLKLPDPQARSLWRADTVYFAHLAVSDPNRGVFAFREKAQRGAMGLAGAKEGRLKVWIGDWFAEALGEVHRLRAQKDGLGLDLALTPVKPPVLHGESGYSRKAAGAESASHYYSITRMATRGKLLLGGRTLEVTGTSWFDREFSTSQLAANQEGWDWFSLQLSDGTDLMLYIMRLKDGTIDPASSGTLVDPQGQARHLKLGDFEIKATGQWKSPHSGAAYPSGWQIKLPDAGYTLTVKPTLADQELRPAGHAPIIYWEGQVTVKGSKNQEPLTGQGYVELTGYAGSLGGRF
ncbi:MAG: lipocalin-like domain-containing protein [Desulfobaccales bacterium]